MTESLNYLTHGPLHDDMLRLCLQTESYIMQRVHRQAQNLSQINKTFTQCFTSFVMVYSLLTFPVCKQEI
jgi:hypothetical protein